jgi:hypothetical protein
MENRILEQIETYIKLHDKTSFIKEVARKASLGFKAGEHFLCYKSNESEKYYILNFRRQGLSFVAYHKASTAIATVDAINKELGGFPSFIRTKVNKDGYSKLTIDREWNVTKTHLLEL